MSRFSHSGEGRNLYAEDHEPPRGRNGVWVPAFAGMTGDASAGQFTAAAARLAGLAGPIFGWRPEEFWRATPAELGAAIGALRGDDADAMTGRELEALQAKFPDGEGPSTSFAGPPPLQKQGRI